MYDLEQAESLRAALNAAAASEVIHCCRSALCTLGASGLFKSVMPLVFVLTLLQPDTVPDPEKAGAKVGDYWSPLKKRSWHAAI